MTTLFSWTYRYNFLIFLNSFHLLFYFIKLLILFSLFWRHAVSVIFPPDFQANQRVDPSWSYQRVDPASHSRELIPASYTRELTPVEHTRELTHPPPHPTVGQTRELTLVGRTRKFKFNLAGWTRESTAIEQQNFILSQKLFGTFSKFILLASNRSPYILAWWKLEETNLDVVIIIWTTASCRRQPLF